MKSCRYFIIIVLMFFGTQFLLSQNQKLTEKDLDNMLKQAVIQSIVDDIVGTPPPPPPTNVSPKYLEAIGVIHFVDGSTVGFRSIIRTHEEPNKDAYSLRSQSEGLYVFYQNSYRTIPYENIASFEIYPERVYNYTITGEMVVTTKSGITFTTPVMISDIDVTIFDDLTNRISEQNFRFASMDRQLISWVEFF